MNTTGSAPSAIPALTQAPELDKEVELVQRKPGIVGKMIQGTGVIAIAVVTVLFTASDKKDQLLRILSSKDNT